MRRSPLLFLQDILASIKDIECFSKGVSEEDFLRNKEKQNAIIRSLEIIGEAVKSLPAQIKTKYQNVEWKKIAGLRDVLIHAYFGADLIRVWRVVKNDLPGLKKEIQEILKKEEKKK